MAVILATGAANQKAGIWASRPLSFFTTTARGKESRFQIPVRHQRFVQAGVWRREHRPTTLRWSALACPAHIAAFRHDSRRRTKRKHVWTDDERKCLTEHYERLQPIWIEAKSIAKDAQKSRETTRKKEWRKAVLSVYPDLPGDLLERYATLRAEDAAPSKIAIIHAARLCVPQADLSPQRLKAQIKAWKVKQSS